MCDELQKVGERIIERQAKEYDLIINISPGESKSTIVTQLFPAWLWTRDPSLRIISGSYSGDLSVRLASKTKDCIKSDLYQSLFGEIFKLRKDFDNKQFYANDKGGERYPVSTGSAVTGSHAHLNIIDDPLSPKQARSEVELKTSNEWIDKTLSSRKVDKAITPTILIMQRLNEADPTGSWLNKDKDIKHICLPASVEGEIKPKDEAVEFRGEKRTIAEWYEYGDGYMNPHRTGESVLKEAKADLGTLEFTGQFLQSPKSREGNIIKRHWIKRYSISELPPGINHCYIDTATSEAELKENDPSGMLYYRAVANKIYLVAFYKGRWSMPDLKEKIKWGAALHLQGRKSKIWIENKSNGRSTKQELDKDTQLSILLENIKGGKLERLENELATIESGRLLFPEGEIWTDDFIEQILGFPLMKHDEEVDCLTGAIRTGLKRRTAKFI